MDLSAAQRDAVVDRILSKVKGGPGGCWIWTGTRNRWGYGGVSVKGRMWLAHRASYTLFAEPIPDGLQVCHRCDNPPCINPKHLFLGTPRDNVADMISKGRAVKLAQRGELNRNAKLTAENVAMVRKRLAAGETQQSIADSLGVSRSAVKDINTGRKWASLAA